MLDPIWKRFCYGQLWPLQPVKPGLAWIVLYARSDFPHLIWLCFSEEGMDHIAQNQPGSDTDGLAGVWLN